MSFQKMLAVSVLVLICVASAMSQFKPKTDQRPTSNESFMRSENSGLMFGWFDPSQFSMRHTYSLSYTSFGRNSISMGEYTNSMFYRISDPLSVQLDISLSHSPHNSLGGRYSNDMNGLRLSRAQINYRPSENTFIQFQFRQVPASSWLGGFDRYGSDFGLDRPEELQR